MSDADLLRRAATKIREIARLAVEGRWAIWEDLNHQGYITVGDEQGVLTDERPSTDMCNPVANVYTRADATHMALWHPGVAVAVAGWLESVADLHEPPNRPPGCQWCTDEDWPCSDMRHALNTARALLGEDTTP